ncbi:PREDICTED: uncharacterized protein LOC109114100 [Nelumbo nucifera]|uniref:Uncharacterized protein LOC109114100 n=1 Tax=Nelumbo nucifera TaxID=4432 RepID=A0A1U8PYY4_NELNU|nr:PREDICTED: uncharacterized protein LOC109114100 [Nelumbo nucifera]
MGFTASNLDSSLFLFNKDGIIIYLLIYVDDLLTTSNDASAPSKFISQQATHFATKDLGDLSYFLGIEVTCFSFGLQLSQCKYIMDLLLRVDLDGCKPVTTPITANSQLSKLDGTPLEDPTEYRSLAPTIEHWNLVKRILRYLKGTIDFALVFHPDTCYTDNGYCDADWAGCLDDRCSVGGYAVFLGSNLISWHSHKQPTIARSSTEAEFCSFPDLIAEIVWLCSLLKELGVSLCHIPCSKSSLSCMY